MQRYFTYLNHKFLLPLVISSFVLFSCVYFNTFYNAETSYEKALKIIEESPVAENDKLPNQAIKLLGEAIENSKLVIDKYPESKYIDDAIFIIARASFLRDEVAIAEKHLNMILKHYPESKYFALSEIWLAYTHFRMGMVDSARTELKIIQGNSPKNKKQLFIIHNVLAEIAMETDSLEQVFHHYELAAEYASTDSKKTATFGILVNIAESEGDKDRASIYLEELGKAAPDKIRIEAKMQWLIYQRELGEFDKIIDEIGSMLSLSEFQGEYIKLDLELGKVYMDKKDYSISKDIFSQMVEVYSKKDETAEAYYHLGDMALKEDFKLDLAKEYFEKSKSEKSQSKYGKKSKEILNKITRFENLLNMYKDVAKNSDEEIDVVPPDQEGKDANMESEANNEEEIVPDLPPEIKGRNFPQDDRFRNSRGPMDFDISNMLDDADLSKEEDGEMESDFSRPDSVLFIIGEMLLYDFNHLERSLKKFKTLAEEYPQSVFAPQALYVLSHFEPDGEWHLRLETAYPNSSFFSIDSTVTTTTITTWIESQRDYAWSLAQLSYEDAFEEFNRLSTEEQDTLSAYITGFINDIYLNDIEQAIQHYQAFMDNFPDHIYAITVKSRLEEIKQNLENSKDISQQGIDYQKAVNYLHVGFNYDSVKVLLSEISTGIASSYKDAANSLKDAIRDYEKLSSEMNNHDTLSIDPAENWSSFLSSDYPNRSSISDSIVFRSIYHPDIFQDGFVDQMESIINDCQFYLEHFPDPVDSSLMFPDTTAIEIDSLVLFIDSTNIQIDSDSLNMILPEEKGELTP